MKQSFHLVQPDMSSKQESLSEISGPLSHRMSETSICCSSQLQCQYAFAVNFCVAYSVAKSKKAVIKIHVALAYFKICTMHDINIYLFSKGQKRTKSCITSFRFFKNCLANMLTNTCIFTRWWLHIPTHQGDSFIILLIHTSSTWYELSDIRKHCHRPL